MNIVNLTPHTLNIHNEDRQLVVAVEPSGNVARCEVERTRRPDFRGAPGVPLFATAYGEVVDLPCEQWDTIYVVSGMARAAVPDRQDVFQPGELLRNDKGQVVGCIGLSR